MDSAHWLPVLDWLPRYRWAWLRPDLLAALTVWALLVSFSRPTGSLMGRLPGADAFMAIDDEPTATMDPGVLVYRLIAPVLTLNAKQLRDRVREEIGTADPTPRLVVVDMTSTSDLDVGTIDVLAGLHRELAERGIALALGHVRGESRRCSNAAASPR